jgi:protein-disulfide isomerase
MNGDQQTDKPEENKLEGKEVILEFSRITLWQIISGILGILLVVSIFTNGFGFGSTSDTGTAAVVKEQPQQPSNNNIPTGIVDVSAGDDTVLGKSNAKVTIIEFSDYQCSYCERFYSQTFSQIKTNYIDTGKVKFVYRDFPLSSIHPMAQKAAEASECADEQGKFWEYQDTLFSKQDEWTTADTTADLTKLKDYAKGLSLDSSKFDTCLDSGKYQKEVEKDEQDGIAAGVQGTPAFFINGQLLSGAQPYSAFQTAIEQALKA